MDIMTFIFEVHDNSRMRGVWDKEHTFAEVCAILNMDLAKATDAYYNFSPVQKIAENLVDCCLDIFDYFGFLVKDSIQVHNLDYDVLISKSTDLDLYSLIAIAHKWVSNAFIKDFKRSLLIVESLLVDVKSLLVDLVETAFLLLRWVRTHGIDEEKLLKERLEIQRRQDVRDGKFGSRYERGGTDRFG